MNKLIEVSLNANDKTLVVTTLETLIPYDQQKLICELGVEVIDPEGNITKYSANNVLSVRSPASESPYIPLITLQDRPIERLPESYSWRLAK
jgi:hypothetical protein